MPRRVRPYETAHCKASGSTYLLLGRSLEKRAMKDVVGVVSDDAVEISVPAGSERRRYSAACLCCRRADQPMDDDGCGICDTCLGLPVRTRGDHTGLEIPSTSSHLSLTTRVR